jgi:predicted nucleic-acid-binding protein
MLAVDTNVVVRIVTNDNPRQVGRAAALVAREDIYLTKSVLLETEWVLRFSYQLSRGIIAQALRRFIGLPNVTVEHYDQAISALDGFEAGMDFADALHLAGSARIGRFATFDGKLARKARKLTRIDIVTP